jgi:hypothetical protein
MGMGKEMLETARADQVSEVLDERMYQDWCKQQDCEWEEEFVPQTWTTNRGEVLFIKDMETLHIQNCITWLKTNRADHPQVNRMVQAFEAELQRRA